MKLGSYDPRDVQQESTRWLPQKIPAQRMFCASKLSCQIKRLRPNGLFTLCCESTATCDRQTAALQIIRKLSHYLQRNLTLCNSCCNL